MFHCASIDDSRFELGVCYPVAIVVYRSSPLIRLSFFAILPILLLLLLLFHLFQFLFFFLLLLLLHHHHRHSHFFWPCVLSFFIAIYSVRFPMCVRFKQIYVADLCVIIFFPSVFCTHTILSMYFFYIHNKNIIFLNGYLKEVKLLCFKNIFIFSLHQSNSSGFGIKFFPYSNICSLITSNFNRIE